MMKKDKYLVLALIGCFMHSCSPTLPENASQIDSLPRISPDYSDLVIPGNIAPLNFNIDEKGDKYITRHYTKGGNEIITSGRTIDIDVDKWHTLLSEAAGDTLYADVYVSKNNMWHKYSTIKYHIAEEIDPYVSYRHIEPLYMNYDVQRICQRCLENFEIDDIYNNSAFLAVEGDRQCVNCHSYQDYNRGSKMQMHIRVNHGGTIIKDGDKMYKVNLKVGDIPSAGQYPSWHPTLPLVAYSYNDTWQHFHTVDNNKVEVQDASSGLIMYDVERNQVVRICDEESELETFPYWSPDGKWLYYVSAKVPVMSPDDMARYRQSNFSDFKYNIYRLSFDAEAKRFGARDTVFDAASVGRSATFPRESPDGRFMIFTLGEYGTFHNFHHDADLYMMDMTSGNVRPLSEINSDDTESYHSWSSNSRWLLFSSRRDNGSYTRLYIAHVDESGNTSKPFILPQRSPFTDDMLFRSYNVPEFMIKPVDIKREAMLETVKSNAKDAEFVNY